MMAIDPTNTVNVIFGRLLTKCSQKLILGEIMSFEPAAPTFLKWSEVPITFSQADQWTSFSEPGDFLSSWTRWLQALDSPRC